MTERQRKPDWLKIKIGGGGKYPEISKIVEKHGLHTICSSGKCPNIGQCWNMGTATFMIGGDICTRSCKFCATKTGKPQPLWLGEPAKIAQSVLLMGLKHCVITSVDRDDLTDKGAEHWAQTIKAIRNTNNKVTVEVLIPDFDAVTELLDLIANASPDIIGHNMETVRRLTPLIRSKAQYNTSLEVIKYFSDRGIITKSGIMAGLGETQEEVVETMADLRNVGCRMFTIGQYLQPSAENIPVVEYVSPDMFNKYKDEGQKLGFDHIESGPLVRSSYMAEKSFLESEIKN